MRLKQLTEVRKRLSVRRNGENRAFFSSTKYGNLPFLTVLHVEHENIIFRTVSITKQGKEKVAEIQKARRNPDFEMDPQTKRLYETFIKYGIAQDGPFENWPDLFKVIDHTDRSEFYTIMMQTYGISPSAMENLYGPLPEIGNTIRVGNAEILLTENPNKTTIRLAKEMIHELERLLDPLGLHGLIAGKYRLAHIGGKAAATFEPKNHWITVDMRYLRRGDAVWKLIHEIGHKWDWSLGFRDEILTDKFRELLKSGHTYSARPRIEVGDQLLYTGPGLKKIKGIPLTVEKIGPKKLTIIGKPRIDRKFRGDVPLEMFSEPGNWTLLDGSPVPIEGEDEWFPTAYSKTNPTEWFAELFVVYVQGEAVPEVKEWFENLPRP